MKEVEDRFHVGLQLGDYTIVSCLSWYRIEGILLTLRRSLVGKEDTSPSIHDAFTERDNVVEHVKRHVRACSYARGLVEHLCDHRQVSVEVCSNGLSNVTERLEDRRLELVAEGRAL